MFIYFSVLGFAVALVYDFLIRPLSYKHAGFMIPFLYNSQLEYIFIGGSWILFLVGYLSV